MATGATGFSRAALQYFRDLEKNNNKEWFHVHKEEFETMVKWPMVVLVTALNNDLSRFAPAYVADPKRISRMNRDTRFSADKSPYRTDISIVFPRAGGEKSEVAGFYVAVSSSGADVLGGVYVPGPEQLTVLRHYFLKHHARLRSLVDDERLCAAMGELQGEQLQRVPRGFDPDHPAKDFLRFKQLYFRTRLPSSVVTSVSLGEEISQRLERLTPFVSFLDEALANLKQGGRAMGGVRREVAS